MTTATVRKPHYFYGWNIVAASFLAHLAYAEHQSSILGFLFKPLQNEFGWSRSAIAATQTIARLTEAMVAPVIGPLIDRYGPRVLMLIGATIVGFVMLGVTQINTIWQFYLLRGIVMAIGFSYMGQLVTTVAINNWFIQKRGRAIAIGRLGSNLSSIAFIPITVFVIAAYGWRMIFVVFAVITWLLVLIPSAIFMRRRPEDMGLHPDGIDLSTAKAKGCQEEHPINEVTSASDPIWSRREVLMTRSFWLLATCFGISSMAHFGINVSLAPYIQDLGYGDTMLAAVMTLRGIIMAISLPIIGFVAEHTHRVHFRVLPFVIQSIAAFLFLLSGEGEPVFLWLAVAVYGFGLSGIGVIQEVLWANYFGRLSLGSVRSLAFLVAVGFGAIGPIAMNVAYDVLGSYTPAFAVIAGLFAVGAFLLGIVQPPKAQRYATVAEMTPSPR